MHLVLPIHKLLRFIQCIYKLLNKLFQEIKKISHYVSHKKGGKGCVRDVIEQVLKVQNKWLNNDTISAKYD